MPVTVSWDDDAHTIVRYDYTEKWTWDDVYEASKEANNKVASVPYTVAIIHNLSESAGMPSGALTHARRITTSIPENWSISIVVGSGLFTESLLNIFSKVYKKLGEHYKTAQTLDQARALIRSYVTEK